MKIAVKHQITDPAKFWSAAEQHIPKAPAGISILQAFPNEDMTSATCLWEAPSVQALKDFVEPLVSDVSDNEYFAVNTAHAIGLP